MPHQSPISGNAGISILPGSLLNKVPDTQNPSIAMLQRASISKFQKRWNDIIDRYSRIDDNVESDEIDLFTGKIHVDNGHIRSLDKKSVSARRSTDSWHLNNTIHQRFNTTFSTKDSSEFESGNISTKDQLLFTKPGAGLPHIKQGPEVDQVSGESDSSRDSSPTKRRALLHNLSCLKIKESAPNSRVDLQDSSLSLSFSPLVPSDSFLDKCSSFKYSLSFMTPTYPLRKNMNLVDPNDVLEKVKLTDIPSHLVSLKHEFITETVQSVFSRDLSKLSSNESLIVSSKEFSKELARDVSSGSPGESLKRDFRKDSSRYFSTESSKEPLEKIPLPSFSLSNASLLQKSLPSQGFDSFDQDYILTEDLFGLDLAMKFAIHHCAFSACSYCTGNRILYRKHLVQVHAMELSSLGYLNDVGFLDSKRPSAEEADRLVVQFPMHIKNPPKYPFVCGQYTKRGPCSRLFLNEEELASHQAQFPRQCCSQTLVILCPILGCGYMTDAGYDDWRCHVLKHTPKDAVNQSDYETCKVKHDNTADYLHRGDFESEDDNAANKREFASRAESIADSREYASKPKFINDQTVDETLKSHHADLKKCNFNTHVTSHSFPKVPSLFTSHAMTESVMPRSRTADNIPDDLEELFSDCDWELGDLSNVSDQSSKQDGEL